MRHYRAVRLYATCHVNQRKCRKWLQQSNVMSVADTLTYTRTFESSLWALHQRVCTVCQAPEARQALLPQSALSIDPVAREVLALTGPASILSRLLAVRLKPHFSGDAVL